MDDDSRNRALEGARALERAGNHDGAWRAYLKANSPDDAARVLAGLGRTRDAAELLLREFAIDANKIDELDATGRRQARKAAVLFSQGEEWPRAGELYGALGDLERAAQCFAKGGDEHTAARLRQRLTGRGLLPRQAPSDGTSTNAALVRPSLPSIPAGPALEVQTAEDRAQAAYRRGDFSTAGRAFLDAGFPWESAVSFSKGEDEVHCLEALLTIETKHARYRGACRHAIHLAHRLGVLSDRLLLLVAPFVSSFPDTDDELAAMLVFAELELRFGHRAHALARVEALATHYPDRAVVHQVAARLRAQAGAAPASASASPDQTGTMPTPTRPDSGLRASALITAGTVLANRFRVEKRIGRGGYASVYRAHDLELDEPLALKVLDSNDNEQGQSILKREVALARRLAHPNIVNVWDFVVHEGLFLIKMELLEGQMLRDRMRRSMTPAQAIDIISQACEGLQFAHDHGIVHRDVKPDNLFITSNNVVKLMDFGVARSFNDAPRPRPSQPVMVAERVRAPSPAHGSPHYMAPEHSSTFEHLAPAADQYALGVVAFELLARRLPFDAATVPEILGLHGFAPLPPLGLADDALSQRLHAVLQRMLGKTVDERFSTCKGAAAALSNALASPVPSPPR